MRKVGDIVYYCEFGENLKKLRTARSLTQASFGNRVGLSKAVVSKYENGLGYPTFDVLIRNFIDIGSIAQHRKRHSNSASFVRFDMLLPKCYSINALPNAWLFAFHTGNH